MKTTTYILYTGLGCLIFINNGCKKQDDFLNAKPNEELAIPSTLQDVQLLLQNEDVFNREDIALGEISSDDYYVPTGAWLGLSTSEERNGYIWAKQVYNVGENINDWNDPYNEVYTADIALETLGKITVTNGQQTQHDHLKGYALFYRAIAFYKLLQTFCLTYDPTTAGTDLGIPLRLSSDLNAKSVRATQEVCYHQVIQDLETALPLLPVTITYNTQPTQPAANALLARVYLVMGNYTNSFQYADASLGQYHALVDYNTLSPNDYSLSTANLAEDEFHKIMDGYTIIFSNDVSITDSVLYNSYAANDLRKTCLYILNGGQPYFRGTYDYMSYNYSGIATDEVYLIRAECSARTGNVSASMSDLNTLLINRWKTGTFIPYTAANADDALKQILTERRKELPFRGLRWTDLRRLNKDPRFAVTLTRIVNGATYTLPPNDPRYAWPFPDNEISGSGIQQNPR